MKPLSLFLCFAVLSSAVPSARASCGAADCPRDPGSSRSLSGGSVTVGYEFDFVPQTQVRAYGDKAAVGQIEGEHDELSTITRLHRLKGAWDVTDRWGLELSLPYLVRAHEHLHHDPGGDEVEGWDLHGLGDLAVGGRWAFFVPEEKDRPTLSITAAVEFPTGAHELKNADGQEAEVPVQPGSGSYDMTAGFSALQRHKVPEATGGEGELPVFFSVSYRWNGRSHDRYRLGSVAAANLGTVYPVSSRLGLMGQANLRVNRRDEAGNTDQETRKTGGTYLFLSPGLEVKASESLTLSALVQFPVYQWVRQIQLASRCNLTAGLSYRFRL